MLVILTLYITPCPVTHQLIEYRHGYERMTGAECVQYDNPHWKVEVRLLT